MVARAAAREVVGFSTSMGDELLAGRKWKNLDYLDLGRRSCSLAEVLIMFRYIIPRCIQNTCWRSLGKERYLVGRHAGDQCNVSFRVYDGQISSFAGKYLLLLLRTRKHCILFTTLILSGIFIVS